ncbi:hypothetical protein NPIL_593121 [Nephila pilipes]|uniref:Uncharacterized protein n=1 Tax=Nephila pilipes TaxID=299642 RepID=A0A8X6T1Q7_NEPPI|nr:hypothetical protein NPIL_593121 [Nephila pilipes]
MELSLSSIEGTSPVNAQSAARSFPLISQEIEVHGLSLPRRNRVNKVTSGSSIYKEGAGAKRSWKACESGRTEVWETMLGRHGGNRRPGKPQENRKERLAGAIKSW